jgi:hypothetical protein
LLLALGGRLVIIFPKAKFSLGSSYLSHTAAVRVNDTQRNHLAQGQACMGLRQGPLRLGVGSRTLQEGRQPPKMCNWEGRGSGTWATHNHTSLHNFSLRLSFGDGVLAGPHPQATDPNKSTSCHFCKEEQEDTPSATRVLSPYSLFCKFNSEFQ